MQAVTSAFFVMSIESAKNGLWKTRNVVGSISTQIGSQTSFLLEDRRGGINFLLKMIYLDIEIIGPNGSDWNSFILHFQMHRYP